MPELALAASLEFKKLLTNVSLVDRSRKIPVTMRSTIELEPLFDDLIGEEYIFKLLNFIL